MVTRWSQAGGAAVVLCSLALVGGCGGEFVSASDMALEACSLSSHASDPEKSSDEGLADLRRAVNVANRASDLDDKYGELAAGLEHMVSAINQQDPAALEISSGIVFDNCLRIETEE